MNRDLTQSKAFAAIADACKELGWSIVYPDPKRFSNGPDIQGLIIGNGKCIDYILDCLPPLESKGH